MVLLRDTQLPPLRVVTFCIPARQAARGWRANTRALPLCTLHETEIRVSRPGAAFYAAAAGVIPAVDTS